MGPWIWLSVAIVTEVVATSALKATEGFRRPWPSALVVAGYATAFYSLSRTLEAIPVGVAYAVWCGVGMALVALAGWLLYGQPLDLAGAAGLALITAGVAVLSLYSRTTAH